MLAAVDVMNIRRSHEMSTERHAMLAEAMLVDCVPYGIRNHSGRTTLVRWFEPSKQGTATMSVACPRSVWRGSETAAAPARHVENNAGTACSGKSVLAPAFFSFYHRLCTAGTVFWDKCRQLARPPFVIVCLSSSQSYGTHAVRKGRFV